MRVVFFIIVVCLVFVAMLAWCVLPLFRNFRIGGGWQLVRTRLIAWVLLTEHRTRRFFRRLSSH